MPFDINSIASKARWLGPVMAIGGGIAALMAFSKGQDGSKFLKYGGISAALTGISLTAMGFKAKGIETGTKATEAEAVAAITQLSQQYEATMQNLANQANTEITTLKQQLAAAGGGTGTGTPQIDPTTGQPIPGAGAGAGTIDPTTGQPIPGAGTPQIDPTTGQPIPGTGGQTTPVGVGAGSVVVPGTGAVPGGTPGATGGTWSIQALVGRSVSLQPGASASGTVIADPGIYKIEQPAGDPNGYATLEEANTAARSTMSTELMGSKFLRWMVVEHAGRFYGAIAKQAGQQDQANPLGPEIGNVVAWSAMNHVSDNGSNGWQAYSWSQPGGAQSMAVPYGTTSVFPGAGVGIGVDPGATGTGTAPAGIDPNAVGGGASVTGGGAVAFDPASQVGRSFSVNAATTAEGDVARGGVVQLQRFVESSSGGFGTPEEAATAARAARSSGGGDQWSRWVSMQGADGRYYVYQGSIVKRETAQLTGAAPLHVFGSGFSEYYDGGTSSWRALRDAA